MVTQYSNRLKDMAPDTIVEEDALIQGLLEAKGRQVEIIAFGIAYNGLLEEVDVESGVITIADGEDRAMIELERIESYTPA